MYREEDSKVDEEEQEELLETFSGDQQQRGWQVDRWNCLETELTGYSL